MSPEEYIRELGLAVTRLEDDTDRDAKGALFDLALRLRALLLTLPEGALERQVVYPRLRERIATELQNTSNRVFAVFRARLPKAEETATRTAAQLFDLPRLAPRDLGDVLRGTRIQTQSLLTLFSPSPGGGLSPFAQQLLRMLDLSVRSRFAQDVRTLAIADAVIGVRYRKGQELPVVSKGTVANGWRFRVKGLVAAAFWALAYQAQQRGARESDRPIEGWQWNAVLDPKTCPVCRPLDGERAAFPEAFPEGPPPLHPFCRCVLVPIYD